MRQGKVLDLGSVVELKDIENAVLIVGWYSPILAVNLDEAVMFDYVGLPLPLGIYSDHTVNFNASDVLKVLHKGYESKKTKAYREEIDDWYDKHRNLFQSSVSENDKATVPVKEVNQDEA